MCEGEVDFQHIIQRAQSAQSTDADRRHVVCFVAFASNTRASRTGELVGVTERACTERFADAHNESLAAYWRAKVWPTADRVVFQGRDLIWI